MSSRISLKFVLVNLVPNLVEKKFRRYVEAAKKKKFFFSKLEVPVVAQR